VQFRVESLKDLNILINHFNEYNLLTQKRVDFELFKLAINIIKNKEHLIKESNNEIKGINKLIIIKNSINKNMENRINNSLVEDILVKLPKISILDSE